MMAVVVVDVEHEAPLRRSQAALGEAAEGEANADEPPVIQYT